MAGPLRCLRQLPPLLLCSSWGAVKASLLVPPGGLVLPSGGQEKRGPPLMAQSRHLATKKSKAKGKGQARVSINASLVEHVVGLEEVQGEMRAVLQALQEDFSRNVSLRTSPGALDHIPVATGDGTFPLNQLGQISLKSPRLILVNMSAFPESTAAALEAIRGSGMNLNPEADGPLIRVPVPTVTREHRENLVAVAKQLTNRAKESLRRVRAAAITQTRKAKSSVSEDTIRMVEKQIQQMTDDAIAEMEKLLVAKTKELLG